MFKIAIEKIEKKNYLHKTKIGPVLYFILKALKDLITI